jgi:outer membrane receptor protein involved in Fe transport
MMFSVNRRSGMMQASDQSASSPEIPSRTVADLGFRTQFLQNMSGSLWVRNLFNKSYYDYATYNGIYPADGRGVFANLKVTF